MTWFRRAVGLDFVDVVIQAGATIALMAAVGVGDGPDEIIALIPAVSFVVLGFRRHFALRRAGDAAGLTTGQMAAERLEDVEQRLSELELSQARVAELEERLDFAERLLARVPSEPARLGGRETPNA